MSIREITRRLVAALGGTLVSALAGSRDVYAAHGWAKDTGPRPSAEETKKLAFTYEQWQKVSTAEGERVARAWFVGANPWLDGDTPISAIREDRLEEVSAAAQSLIDDSFTG
jgi:hypothetical protein